MVYGIGLYHKDGKKHRMQLDNTTDPYSAPSTHLYSYNKLNENTDSNTTFVIPPCFYTYIKTQCSSASDASAGANDVSSVRLYQSTNHHDNTDGKDNDG